MARTYDIVTFDCYGTLIDWERGLSDAFLAAAQDAGHTLDRSAVIAAHAAIEPRVQQRGYQRYRDVLADVTVEMATQLGWSLLPGDAGFLADSVPNWRPFADTNPALERLIARGHRLGILSNIDDDLLAATRRHFTVDFELVVTAEQVRSYKPGHAHFERARGQIGGARWLHAAQSYFHDVVPACALRIPVAWINRKGEVPSGEQRPDVEVGSLADFSAELA